MFLVDYYILIVRLLPPELRKPKMIAWLYRLSKPIIELHSSFLSFRNEKIIRVSVNGQTIALEWLLNTLFDPNGNGIYILTNSQNLNANFVFSETNNAAPLYVYSETDTATPLYLYAEKDYLKITHFTIYIPSALVYDGVFFEAVVNYYKLAGKKWNIQTY